MGRSKGKNPRFLGYLKALTSSNVVAFFGVNMASTLELLVLVFGVFVLGAATVVKVADLIAVENRLLEHSVDLIVNKTAPS